MSASTANGWLIVDCDAPDATVVEIAVGKPDGFAPAFRDYADGNRVAKIRLPETKGRARVYLRVAGKVSEAGLVTL